MTLRLLVVAILGFALSETALANFPFTPDASIVGSLCTTNDSDFLEYRYSAQVPYCRRNVTTIQKRKIYDAYAVPPECQKEYTIDHFIPLSMGGTNRANNLWPEAKIIKKFRQNLELDLFQRLQRGEITQAQAIEAIRDAKLNPPIANPGSLQFCL